MDKIQSRNDWIFGNIKNPLLNKDYLVKHNILQMLNKSTRIFKYDNLPETISTKDLETQLQVGGFSIWKDVDGKLYSFIGTLGGEPNPYYLPTIAIVANPALRYNKSLEIDKECVVMLNDNYYQGLMPLFSKYGNLLTEAEISLKYAIINSRIPAIIQADNETTKESAEEFFKKIIDGTDYGVVGSREMLDGIRSHDFYKQTHIKDVIESIQYLKGSWYNEIGLNAAFNMKREAINEAEATLNEDILYPTIDTMLDCRRRAVKKINEMFDQKISVDLDGVWMQNREHEQMVFDMGRAEIENLENETEDKTEEEDETNRDIDNTTED